MNNGIGRPENRDMVPKSVNWLSIFGLIAILCMSIIPTGNVRALTDLDVFVEHVKNGQSGELRGIYIPGILAARVVQQPSGKPEFVSSWEDIATQFSLASKVGSTGLLAHNYLAGQSFSLLQEGQEFYLIYGDGQVDAYHVSEILRYQALESTSTSSRFVNLTDGHILTHEELFMNVYKRPGHAILQTCITMNDDPSGGRLFIIAKPALP